MSEGNQREEDAGAAARGAPSPGLADQIPLLSGEGEEEEGVDDAGAAARGAPGPGFADRFTLFCERAENEDEVEEEDEGDDDAEGEGLGSGGGEDASCAGTTSATPRGDGPASLLRARKLILVLDLDHTLLNSVRHADLSGRERRNGFTKHTADDPSRGLFRLDSHSLGMLTKLRPFVHGFLREASAMFQMYVYTMGDREYARACANLLDPDGVYFGARIISRDESTHEDKKNLDVVVPEAEWVAVVILDDRESAWEEHSANLILVRKYRFFADSGPRHDGSWRSLAEAGFDESKSGGTLATLLDVLRRVHGEFFASVSGGIFSDVRVVLRELRRLVLPGCTVVFSRVIPTKVRLQEHTLWRMAEMLGAVCAAEVDATVTHVIAKDRDSNTAQWALLNSKFLVHREWLHDANFNWRRPAEHSYPVIRAQAHA